jgi:hypothetical protein
MSAVLRLNPINFARRVRRVFRDKSDIVLALQVGYFIFRAPTDLARHDVRRYLDGLSRRNQSPSSDVKSAVERIARFRDLWLRLPFFRNRNTCFLRALTVYRFLNASGVDVRIHFGIEQRDDPNQRLHSHAWVTADGARLESAGLNITGRLTEVPIQSGDR